MEKNNIQKFRFFIKIFRFWKNLRDKFAASLDVNFDRKVELYVELSKSATLRDIVYWLQLLASAGIATLGLVQNSTAVIIGAMLISPLMGPILSAGLALATGDLILAFRSIANLILSTVGAIILAVLLIYLLPFRNETAEILSRTEPNTLDLVIALFSGAIGSIATCRQVKGVVTSIPGVAIAVALMPPLCVVGYGTGVAVSGDGWAGLGIAAGGGLLYLTNLVAITFTSMLVFVMLRIDTAKVREKVQLWRETDREHLFWRRLISKVPQLEQAREIRSFSLRLMMVLIPLLIIFVPLSQSFSKMRDGIVAKQTQNKLENDTKEIWEKIEEPNDTINRGEIDDFRVKEKDGVLDVYLRVFRKKRYNKEQRDEFVTRLSEKFGKSKENISLQLIEIPLSEKEKISPIIQATPTPETVAQVQTKYLEKVRSGLNRLELPEPAYLIDYDVIIKSNNAIWIQIYYLSGRDIGDDGKSLLEKNVKELLNLQNLTLSYTRIPSDEQEVTFEKNKAELSEDEREKLSSIEDNLLEHPNLRLRFMLVADENNEELLSKRKTLIKEIIMLNDSVSEDRLAFSDIEDGDNSNSYQYFIRE